MSLKHTHKHRSLVSSKLNPSPKETAEARYVSLFQFLDLGKGDFFFSYTCMCVCLCVCLYVRGSM